MTDLPYTTPLQFLGLALALLAGWLLGLASNRSGRKWRDRYEAEEAAHLAQRDELAAANARIQELEAINARLERSVADRRPVAPVADAAPNKRDSAIRSWFYGGTDVLARIHGIDEHRERQLNQLGIQHFRDIENLPREDELPLEERLGLPRGTIVEERWREQAALLRAGRTDEHAGRFGQHA